MRKSELSESGILRARWYLQAERGGKAVREVCATFGISRKTYYKWYRRDHGLGGNDRKAPKAHPSLKLTPEVRELVAGLKLRYGYGPRKMSLCVRRLLGLTVSSTVIYRFYRRRGLIMKPQRRMPWYRPMRERFVAKAPGENVQADVKYVPRARNGWGYQFRFADTVCNLQFAVDMPDKTARSAVRALAMAEAHLPFRIAGIQTDNGGEFRGGFAEHLRSRGIAHRFIPKRSAPWNGKVERANRSIDDEFYLNPGRPWETLAEYVHWYNHERPHLGKGMEGLTPHEKYLQCLSSMPKSVTLEC